MANPTLYEPGYDFVATDKGAELNVELENIQAAIASVADALADVRRSDGELQNGIVGADALDPLALATAEPIAAALVEQLEAAIADVADDVVAAAASAAAAETSRENADVAAVSATASAVAAATSATAAAASATAASSSAGSASGHSSAASASATTASTQATAAAASASAAATSASGAAAAATAALTASRYAFSARKAADQTGIVTATATKLIFPTELFDFGGFYDAGNSRFTPVAGKYRLSVGAGWSGGLVDTRQVTAEVWKNGAVFRVFGVQVSGTTDNALVSGECLVEANGTDYFEVYGTGFGVGNKTVSGTVSLSWFEGEAV